MRRGQVYMADLGVNIGSVQNNVRPVLIVQNNTGNRFSPNVIVVPLTSRSKRHYPTHYQLYNHPALGNSIILCEQITTISKSQLDYFICSLSDDDMMMVDVALRCSIDC